MQTSEAANQEGSSYLGSLSRRHEGQQMVTGGLGADNIFINGLWTLLKQGLQQILMFWDLLHNLSMKHEKAFLILGGVVNNPYYMYICYFNNL